MTEALEALPPSPLRTLVYNLRKAHHHRRSQALTLAIQLPTSHPDWPEIARLHSDYTAWQHAAEEKNKAESDIRTAHGQVLHIGCSALQNLAEQNDTLRRALLFSSHDLLRALPGFAQKPPATWGKKERAIALTLTEYLSRAVHKTAPLSRWATVGVWRLPSHQGRSWGWVDTDKSAALSQSKSILTPNVQLLPLLYEVLLREPAFYRSLALALNPSYGAESGWLYFDGEQEAFQQLTANPVVDWIVETLLQSGRKMPFTDLLIHLSEAVEASAEILQNLVFELIDIGLLEWQLPERGLSPSWANSLYQYLGYLPSAQMLTDAAFLLQWLRMAARTIPFQPVEEAQSTQSEALEQVSEFFRKYDCAAPLFSAEQIFYEDVERSVRTDVPQEAVQQVIQDLAACWQLRDMHPQPMFRARLFEFARRVLAPGEAMDFLSFSRQFLEEDFPEKNGAPPVCEAPRYRGKVGAVIQIFQENGEYRAAVNGLFPGGGKLFARWLHLLPTDFREAVEDWGKEAVQFGWQGWSNANFQPLLGADALWVPGGRTSPKSGGSALPLADFEVRLNEAGVPQLVHRQSGKPMICTDLGLEAPETRPPAIQVLWHLTVPYVSAEMLLPGHAERHEEAWGWFSPRIGWRSLVLRRQSWELRPEVWRCWVESLGSDSDFFLTVRTALLDFGVPSRFFAHFPLLHQAPQQLDGDSPLMMRVFRKMLTQGSGSLVLTEAVSSFAISSFRDSSSGVGATFGSPDKPCDEMMNDEMANDKTLAAEFVLEFSVF